MAQMVLRVDWRITDWHSYNPYSVFLWRGLHVYSAADEASVHYFTISHEFVFSKVLHFNTKVGVLDQNSLYNEEIIYVGTDKITILL